MSLKKIDIKNYNGEIDPTILIPHIGSSFKDVTGFKEIVCLLEQWQYKSALDKLDYYIFNDIQLIDSLLLKGELLAIFEYNQQAMEVFEIALQYDPKNTYALNMVIIQLIIMNRNKDEIDYYYAELKSVSLKIHDKLKSVIRFIEKNKKNFNIQAINKPVDLICLFGYFLNEDGSVPAKLERRLIKTYELAKSYPQAKILMSGGAVQNKYCEAIEMKKYLVKAGITEDRLIPLKKAKDTVGNILEFMEYINTRKFSNICAVTSTEHLPRAWMSLYTGLNESMYAANLFGAVPTENMDPETFEKEVQLSYQTILRVAGLFTKQDIERQLKNC